MALIRNALISIRKGLGLRVYACATPPPPPPSTPALRALQVQVESADVAEERARVEALAPDDPDASIVLRDLCKVYPAEVRYPAPRA